MTGIDLTTSNINTAVEETKEKGEKKDSEMTVGDWAVVGFAGLTLVVAGATCYKVYTADSSETAK